MPARKAHRRHEILARHVIEHDVGAHADFLDIRRRWILRRLNQSAPVHQRHRDPANALRVGRARESHHAAASPHRAHAEERRAAVVRKHVGARRREFIRQHDHRLAVAHRRRIERQAAGRVERAGALRPRFSLNGTPGACQDARNASLKNTCPVLPRRAPGASSRAMKTSPGTSNSQVNPKPDARLNPKRG